MLKRNVLPWLYILQTPLIHVPKAFLRSVKTKFINFLWAYEARRILYRLLSLPKLHGGMGFPDPFKYYLAVHMSRILDWIKHGDMKRWVRLEQDRIPLLTPPWQYPTFPHLISTYLIGSTLQALSKLECILPSSSGPSEMSTVIGVTVSITD